MPISSSFHPNPLCLLVYWILFLFSVIFRFKSAEGLLVFDLSRERECSIDPHKCHAFQEITHIKFITWEPEGHEYPDFQVGDEVNPRLSLI